MLGHVKNGSDHSVYKKRAPRKKRVYKIPKGSAKIKEFATFHACFRCKLFGHPHLM